MVQYKGQSGRSYVMDKRLGQGGEGAIYSIQGDTRIVAKIYLDSVNTSDKRAKIEAMVKMSGFSGMEYTTWPQDMLFEGRKFVGFIMNRINSNRKINEIYSPDPDTEYNWRKKIGIAINLCKTVRSLHEINQICGDFNPNNICVDIDMGFLYLIDTDSFHISDNSKTYRCSVGMPNYLPPELQSRMRNTKESLADLNLPTFTKDTDNFALAIHIFQLLMNGCHPFTLSNKNEGDSVVAPPIDDNIVSGESAFFKKSNKYDIPVYSLKIEELPDYISSLFERAFVKGCFNPSSRPSPSEWIAALTRLSQETTKCSVNNRHQYYNGNKNCPWCRIEKDQEAKLNRFSVTNPPAHRPSNYSYTPPVQQYIPTRPTNPPQWAYPANQPSPPNVPSNYQKQPTNWNQSSNNTQKKWWSTSSIGGAAILSLIIPGAGQMGLKNVNGGLFILLGSLVVLYYLINSYIK